MPQPVAVQCLQVVADFFWICGLSMVGQVQQTVQSPQVRPGTNVMPSHMAANYHGPSRPTMWATVADRFPMRRM